jgi:hypothetical protein
MRTSGATCPEDLRVATLIAYTLGWRTQSEVLRSSAGTWTWRPGASAWIRG